MTQKVKKQKVKKGEKGKKEKMDKIYNNVLKTECVKVCCVSRNTL